MSTYERTVKCPICGGYYSIFTDALSGCAKCGVAHHYNGTAWGGVGFVGRCACGWRSEEHATPRDAQTAVAAHLASVRIPEPRSGAAWWASGRRSRGSAAIAHLRRERGLAPEAAS